MFDLLSGSRIPTFSSNKVAVSTPSHAVFTTSQIGVSDGGTAITPKRVVIPIVGPGAVGRSRAAGLRDFGAVAGPRRGEDSSDSEGGQEDRRRENHDNFR